MRVERQLWFWVAALIVLVLAIALLRDILLPFVAAIVVAYFLNPIADRLQARGLNRAWAAILIVGVVAVLVALALILLVPVLVDQIRQMVAALPGETERFKTFVERFGRDWLGPELSLLSDGARPDAGRAVAELGGDGGRHHGVGVEPRAGAGELRLPAAHHAGGRVLPAGRLAPDAGARRPGAAARSRPDHPPPRRRHQRCGCRLHPRPGRHLPGARHLLRHRLELGRHRLRPPGGAQHRPAGLHSHRRLAAGAASPRPVSPSYSSGRTRRRC